MTQQFTSIRLLLTTLLLAGFVSCERNGSSDPNPSSTPNREAISEPPKFPIKGISVAIPPPAPAEIDGKDVSNLPAINLRAMVYEFVQAKSYRKAAICQSWIVKMTDEGRYDLACYEAQASNAEAALYWLQEAGRLEGLSARWSRKDPDLYLLHNDHRWPTLQKFLRDCERYWRVAKPKQTVLIVPQGYDAKIELPLIIWFHGMGGSPTDGMEVYQALADKYRVGFVGVSGPVPFGKTKFAWADVANEDFDRVQAALAEVRGRVLWRQGTVVALGFSQGAMVAVEIAVRHPEVFAGAITISAGSGSPVQLDEVYEKASLPRQGFVIVCGDKENESSVERSNELADWLKFAKSNVLRPTYPNHSTHSFPEDFEERFSEWIEFIKRSNSSS